MNKFVAWSFLLVFSLSCKTQQPQRPDEVYLQPGAIPPSTIRLPLKIPLDDLEEFINRQLDQSLLSDSPTDFGQGWKVQLQKSDTVRLIANGYAFQYRVPLHLEVEKNMSITTARASGEIELHFQTNYQVDSTWNLRTQTTIDHYEWRQKPVLKLGIVKLPLQFLANELIERSKASLARQIDQQLQQRFALKEYASLALDSIQQPFYVSEDYDAWLAIRPSRIAMAPLLTHRNYINTTLLLEARMEVTAGGSTDLPDPVAQLPMLEEEPISGEGFQLFFQTSIPYSMVEAKARESFIGQEYTDGKKKVRVEDIEVFGHKNELAIHARLSGDYDGSIYLTGKPVYNPDRQQLELDHLDFELTSRQFLQKTLAWLLKRNFKKRLRESLYYPAGAEMTALHQSLQSQMSQLVQHPNLQLQGAAEDLTIRQIFVERQHLLLVVEASGDSLNLRVKNLDNLHPFQNNK